jgi:hypothetical protein
MRKKMGRLLRVFTPFALLLVGLIVLNIRIEDSPTPQPSPVPTSSSKQKPTSSEIKPSPTGNKGLETIATAIINATEMPTLSPEKTPQPTSTLLPRDIVTLTGPPDQSRLSLSDPLTFYWFARRALSEGEYFALYVINSNEETLVGTLSEPNLGRAFQVNFIPESYGLSTGEYDWIVKIVDREKDVILGESDKRSISLIETVQ